VTAIPLPFGNLGDELGSIFAGLDRLVAAGSPSRKAGTVWLWPSGIEAADFVLAATSRGDLVERIDECVEERGRQLFDGLVASYAAAPSTPSDPEALLARLRADAEPGRKRLVSVLGETASQRWLAGWSGIIHLVSLVSLLSKAAPLTPKKRDERLPKDSKFHHIMYAAGVGLPFRRALLDLIRGTVALLPIQRAYEIGSRLEPWLALALADVFATGYSGFLDALESATEVRAELANAFHPTVLAEWDRAAAASGQPVYFPLGDADDR
jgi:hypothetical protein